MERRAENLGGEIVLDISTVDAKPDKQWEDIVNCCLSVAVHVWMEWWLALFFTLAKKKQCLALSRAWLVFLSGHVVDGQLRHYDFENQKDNWSKFFRDLSLW